MKTITVLKALNSSLRRAEVVGMDSTHSYDCLWCHAGVSWCKDWPRTRRADNFRADHQARHGEVDDGIGALVILLAVAERVVAHQRQERARRHSVHPWMVDANHQVEVSTCSVCGKPAHASETDDLDRCADCAKPADGDDDCELPEAARKMWA